MKNNWKTIVLMALNGSGVNESDALMQIRVIEPMIEEYLAEQKKELMEEIKEELRTWINDNNVDFNGTDVTYTAELANYVDNKLNHHD